MTMVRKKVRTIPAGEFKAKCLKLIDEVAETGEEIVVTKRGKIVARLVPPAAKPRESLAGTIAWEKDIVSPVDDDWDADE